MEIYNGKQYIQFSDIISYLEEFNGSIIELEFDNKEANKTIEQLEDRANDRDYEIERLQKLLDENGIKY